MPPSLIESRTSNTGNPQVNELLVRRPTGTRPLGTLNIIHLWLNSSNNNDDFDDIPGWTRVGRIVGGNQLQRRPRGIVFARITDQTEGDELMTWGGEAAQAFAFYLVWDGNNVDDPIEGFAAVDQQNTTELDIDAIVASLDGSTAFAAAGRIQANQDWEVIAGVGWPIGTVPQGQRGRSDSSNDVVTVAWVNKDTDAGSTEDVTIGGSSTDRNMSGFQLVIRPEGVVPPAGGTLEIGDGVEFISGIPKVFDGVDFITTTPRIFDGVDFIP